MTAERVDEALSRYAEAVSRTEYLREQNRLLNEALQLALSHMVSDEVSLSQQLTGMPHGTMISDPTGRLGMWFAEGHESWTVEQIKAEIKTNKGEIASLRWVVCFVPAWIKGLNDNEARLIRLKYFNRLTFSEMAEAVEKETGVLLSRSGIVSKLKAAKRRIYRLAR